MNPLYLYLDNNGTTRMSAAALRAFITAASNFYGNPSAAIPAGEQAKEALVACHEDVQQTLGWPDCQLVWTSGGTESVASAIHSALQSNPDVRRVITSPIEHDAVLSTLERYGTKGWMIEKVPVGSDGHVNPADYAWRLEQGPAALIVCMAANNETGCIQPIAALADLAARYETPLLIDAAQAAGRIPYELPKNPWVYLAFSSHKFHGPKGVGGVLLGDAVPWTPMFVGGKQQGGLRAGTENVPGIVASTVALGEACEPEASIEAIAVARLRDVFEAELRSLLGPNVRIVGRAPRLWNTSLVAIRGASGREMQKALASLPNPIQVGTGSACSCLKNPKPSATVSAMGVPADFAMGTLRLSFSRYHSKVDANDFARSLARLVARAAGASASLVAQ